MSITRISLSITFTLFFFGISCNQVKQEKVKQPVKKAEKPIIKKKPLLPKLPVVTNKNVVQFLTKYGEQNKETLVLLKTDFGDMKIKLYKETFLHRANFIRLVKMGFYDHTYFYRVVKGFVLQGGDSDDDSRKVFKKKAGKYTIPSEFIPKYFHKKGAIAMTRDYKDNPDKRSSSFDFYIIQGEKYTNFQLDALENQYNIKIDENKRKFYRSIGGTPHLDGEHTVFGEVIDGFDVIDKIAAVKTDRADWPVDDVYINKIKILK